MTTNPFEPPQADNMIRRSSGNDTRFVRGIMLAGGSVILPVVGWYVASALPAILAPNDPLPQSAMVVALLFFLTSVALGVTGMIAGVWMTWTSRYSDSGDPGAKMHRVLFDQYGTTLWLTERDELYLNVLCGRVGQYGVEFRLNEAERAEYRRRGDAYIRELDEAVQREPAIYAARGRTR